MIYIFSCAKEICSIPGKLCGECAKVCDYINCDLCQAVCQNCARCCSGFLEKPLSSYVVVSFILNVIDLFLCASAMNSSTVQGCGGRLRGLHVGVMSWLLVQMGFAGVNLLFAPYFQSKVWQHLCEQVAAGGAYTGGGVIGSEVVQRSFKDVFLHDFGVLFYFFALVASFFWSMKGSDWQFVAYCNPLGFVANAAWLGMCQFWITVFYSVTWYWCSCCARSVDPMAVRSDIETGHVVPGYAPNPSGMPQADQALYFGSGPGTGNQAQGYADPKYQPIRR